MAFPWIFESNFEAGDASEWDSETDTASQLSVVSYRELAALPWNQATPFSGAYCAKLALTGGTADAVFTEGDIDIAADATRYFAFNVWFSPDFDATADDTVHLFELKQAGGTVEGTFGFRYVAATDVINFGVGETAPTVFTSEAIEKGVWYTVELEVDVDDGASDDGSINLYITKYGTPHTTTVAATVGSLDQGAIGQGVLGVQNQLATTTGTILLDNFLMDDARIFPRRERFSSEVVLTKSGHVFVGPGRINNISMHDGGSGDSVVEVYDTDRADSDHAAWKARLTSTANDELVDPAGMPVSFARGCYVKLSGTNPRATVQIDYAPHYSTAGYKQLGRMRP